jgi:hypothetical protein
LPRKGALNTSQKERCRRENLCLYCAAPDHKIAKCPNMSPAAKIRYTAVHAVAKQSMYNKEFDTLDPEDANDNALAGGNDKGAASFSEES